VLPASQQSSGSSEDALVEMLRLLFEKAASRPEVILGIGDDAALMLPPQRAGTLDAKLVLSVDTQVEGVHFKRSWLTLSQIGYRATMAAASDLAAMAAEPVAALSSLLVPASLSQSDVSAIAEGQAEACAELGMAMVGGNLSRATELSVTTTVIGTADAPVRRAGGQVGDGLYLAGTPGLAGAGLRAFIRGIKPMHSAFVRPKALIQLGLSMAGVAHAAMDVSDGLSSDLARLAQASGVGIELDSSGVLVAGGQALLDAAAQTEADPLMLALHGGEDYLLVALCAAPLPGFVHVGKAVAAPGVRVDGKPLLAGGYDHFAERSMP
jgi:thiamine-monophosphate kinase